MPEPWRPHGNEGHHLVVQGYQQGLVGDSLAACDNHSLFGDQESGGVFEDRVGEDLREVGLGVEHRELCVVPQAAEGGGRAYWWGRGRGDGRGERWGGRGKWGGSDGRGLSGAGRREGK